MAIDPFERPVPVVASGLPGRMAALAAEALEARGEFRLVCEAFSGESAAGGTHRFHNKAGEEVSVALLGPLSAKKLRALASREGPALMALDFSTPAAATSNALACAEAGIPFATGTTGIDMDRAREAAIDRGVPGLAATNFAIPLAILDALLRWGAFRYPGAMEGLELSIRESHQAAKRDVSGTARAFLKPLSKLAGLEPDEGRIESIRDPEAQRALGIPEEALGGHAWHRYELSAPGGSISLALEHSVAGRSVYIDGALRALRFLAFESATRRRAGLMGAKGKGALFRMEDALASTGSA